MAAYPVPVISSDWTPHRREDGELVGWIRPDGADWTAVDLLGREIAVAVEWLDAEEALEAHGIRYLADVWMLEGEAAQPLRVRMVEVTPEHIVVKVDDFGDVGGTMRRFELPWPLPARLRAPRDGDPDAYTIG